MSEPSSRTQVILSAITAQLQARRDVVDRSTDLGEMHITVRLTVGTNVVRSTTITEEHINRQTTYYK